MVLSMAGRKDQAVVCRKVTDLLKIPFTMFPNANLTWAVLLSAAWGIRCFIACWTWLRKILQKPAAP